VLEECCECLARILIHLPQFEPRALAETLSRLSRMTEQVEAALRAFIAETGVDEIMATGQIYDHAARLRSFEILAEIGQRLGASAPGA